MARDESKALGGYFATPPELIPSIAALCEIGPVKNHHAVLDPCAADGHAAVEFAKLVLGRAWGHVQFYGCEAEWGRYQKLAARSEFAEGHLHVLHGDAFAAEWKYRDVISSNAERYGATVCWFNPPYDMGTLEQKFLDRYTDALQPGAGLVALIPVNALVNCAVTLATFYDVEGCYKFPEPLFSEDKNRAFKQVVLYARRRNPLLDPDPATLARLMAWAAKPNTIPVLPAAGTAAPILTIEGHPPYQTGYWTWRMRPADIEGLLRNFRPFHFTDRTGMLRPIPGIVPPADAHDLFVRNFPVATPLKPAYIATAIAAGVFDGEEIVPDDPDSGWPTLLVKGVFDRDLVEVDEKVNGEGIKKGSVKVQQPRLRVTVLDLRTKRYHTLVDSDEESESTTVDRMTTADLLAIYGRALLSVMLVNCPVLHDPQNMAHEIDIAAGTRPLYRAQSHAVMTAVKLLGGLDLPKRRSRGMYTALRRQRRGKCAVILGEVGVGKSGIALITAKTIAAPVVARGGTFRILALCPPHLKRSWRDQVAAVMPECRVVDLDDIGDVDALAADPRPGMVLGVLSRETAKLGHAWEGVGHQRVHVGFNERCGFAFSTGKRARHPMPVRLIVRKMEEDAEVFAAIEDSHDGVNWSPLAAFDEMSAPGEQVIEARPNGRFVRVAWSSTGPATFAVLEDAHEDSKCPRCGHQTPRPQKGDITHRDELARRHARCERSFRMPLNMAARAKTALLEALYSAYPHAPETQGLVGRMSLAALSKARMRLPDLETKDTKKQAIAEAAAQAAWVAIRDTARLRMALDMTVRARCRHRVITHSDLCDLDVAVQGLLWAIGDEAAIARAAVRIFRSDLTDTKLYGNGAKSRGMARGLLLMMTPDCELQRHAIAEMRATGVLDIPSYSSGFGQSPADPWAAWSDSIKAVKRGGRAFKNEDGLFVESGVMIWRKLQRGSGRAALYALSSVGGAALWGTAPECTHKTTADKPLVCGEPLYQAVADPQRGGRRYQLSRYIKRRHPKLFDMMFTDESQELASGSSAQAAAAYRLVGIGIPTLDLTGTAMGGYAEQLFNRQRALDPKFREEFTRAQRSEFVDRYGFVKVLERDVNTDTGEVVEYGSVSDRVVRETRIMGNAPGVLPLFLLKYLLRISVVIHKSDLAIEIPECIEEPITIDPGDDVRAAHDYLLKELKDQIKDDRTDPLLAGKLWGMLAHFATDYPLLASSECGNHKSGAYQIRYPNNPELGVAAGAVIAAHPGFPKDMLLPIEQWTVDKIKEELAEGRRVIVLATSSSFLPRMRRMLQRHLGEPVIFLDAKKVDTAHREDWINQEIVAKGIRVMVVNPDAIQTGLNPLVHFHTEIWLQNPGCKAITYRQAVGRVDRIGQKKQTRIFTVSYDLPPAQAAYTLWQHKIAVSLATDGLDAAGALAAAGVGGGEGGRLDGFAVGKMIFEIMTGEKKFKSRKHVAVKVPRGKHASTKGESKGREVTQNDLVQDANETLKAIAFG